MSETPDRSTSRRMFLKGAAIAAGGVFALARLFRMARAGEQPLVSPVPAPTEALSATAELNSEVNWSKFTELARRIVFFAQEEAAQRGENDVGTEHLLLGLARENDTVAARILDRLGVSLEHVRADTERQMKPGSGYHETEMQLTPPAVRAINLSFEEARQLDNNYLGTEHLLLGLIREGESPAARVLMKRGADLERVRGELVLLYQELA